MSDSNSNKKTCTHEKVVRSFEHNKFFGFRNYEERCCCCGEEVSKKETTIIGTIAKIKVEKIFANFSQMISFSC